MLELKVIDEIITEPVGGAHRDKNLILENIRISILNNLNLFKDMSYEEILNQRKNKFLKIGRSKGFIGNLEELSDLKSKNDYFIETLKSKKGIYTMIGIGILMMLSIYFFL